MLLMARSNHTDNGHRILTQGAEQNLNQQPPEYIFPFLAMMGIPAQLKSLVGWKSLSTKGFLQLNGTPRIRGKSRKLLAI